MISQNKARYSLMLTRLVGTETRCVVSLVLLSPRTKFIRYVLTETNLCLLFLKLFAKQGLADLLARDVLSGKTEVEKAEIILRTQLFYFNRVTGQNLTAKDIRSYQDTTDSQHFTENMDPSPTYRDGETRPLTFAELKTLIEQGKTDGIPNNKVIPDTLSVSLIA